MTSSVQTLTRPRPQLGETEYRLLAAIATASGAELSTRSSAEWAKLLGLDENGTHLRTLQKRLVARGAIQDVRRRAQPPLDPTGVTWIVLPQGIQLLEAERAARSS